MFHPARNAKSMGGSPPIVSLSPRHFERVAAMEVQTTHDHLSSSNNLKQEDWLLFWLLGFHSQVETIPIDVSGHDDRMRVQIIPTWPGLDLLCSLRNSSRPSYSATFALSSFPLSILLFPVLSFSIRCREDRGNAGVPSSSLLHYEIPPKALLQRSHQKNSPSDLLSSTCN